MHITKMHGAGNDFVIIEDLERKFGGSELSSLAVRLCREHTGIGADGMMVVVPAESDGDIKMIFLNRDGSRGEMCGNGARCICRYTHERGFSTGDIQRVETDSGTVVGERISKAEYRIRLNDPSVIDLHRDAFGYDCGYIELGCPGLPHAVVVMDRWYTMPHSKLFELGRALRSAPAFPKGANVSFVSLEPDGIIKAVTFERGVEDFTLACGTGCGSIASVLSLRGITGSKGIRISMPGGILTVDLTVGKGRTKDIFLQGPTAITFSGETYEI